MRLFQGLTNKKQENKDFQTVPISTKIEQVNIPIIPLEKYPEIIKRGKALVVKVSEAIAEQEGKDTDKVLEELEPRTLLDLLPKAAEVAAEEFFPFLAYILEIDERTVRDMGLSQVTRVIRATWEHNDFKQVQKDLENFTRPLLGALFEGQQKKQ